LQRIEQNLPPASPQYAALFTALAKVVHQWQLPTSLFHDLLSAFEQDVVIKRYADLPSLLDYCSRSANPVGRLMLHLYGALDETALQQSDAI
ncbi:squalene/phytoene synthase family protein, partial [Acinetobacter baumannii]